MSGILDEAGWIVDQVSSMWTQLVIELDVLVETAAQFQLFR